MEFLVQLLIAAVEMGTPLLLATLGGVISERAGVINLGMEGLMLVGALAAFVVMLHTGSPILAVALAAIAGGLVTMLHGLVCLMLRANQIASGLALTLFGTGLSGLFGSSLVGKTFNPIEDIPIPFLNKIPLIGEAFFNQDMLETATRQNRYLQTDWEEVHLEIELYESIILIWDQTWMHQKKPT